MFQEANIQTPEHQHFDREIIGAKNSNEYEYAEASNTNTNQVNIPAAVFQGSKATLVPRICLIANRTQLFCNGVVEQLAMG